MSFVELVMDTIRVTTDSKHVAIDLVMISIGASSQTLVFYTSGKNHQTPLYKGVNVVRIVE